MQRKRILELAKQAGFYEASDTDKWMKHFRGTHADIERFAALIEAETIERCAVRIENGSFLHDQSPAKLLATEAAAAIRSLR